MTLNLLVLSFSNLSVVFPRKCHVPDSRSVKLCILENFSANNITDVRFVMCANGRRCLTAAPSGGGADSAQPAANQPAYASSNSCNFRNSTKANQKNHTKDLLVEQPRCVSCTRNTGSNSFEQKKEFQTNPKFLDSDRGTRTLSSADKRRRSASFFSRSVIARHTPLLKQTEHCDERTHNCGASWHPFPDRAISCVFLCVDQMFLSGKTKRSKREGD